jgi:Flp pilus assembly protein TadD
MVPRDPARGELAWFLPILSASEVQWMVNGRRVISSGMSALTIDHALALAVQHHHAGRVGEAEAIYRKILAQQPDHADALNMLGALAAQAGRNDIAVDLIGKSIALKPHCPEAYGNLGNALMALGRRDDAIDAYRTATQLRPTFIEAHNNLGNALREQGRLAEAVATFRVALQLNPDHAETHNNLSAALSNQGHPGSGDCRLPQGHSTQARIF